jgi:hypothetical protein
VVLSATNAFKDYSRKFETYELLNPLYHFVSFRQKSIGAATLIVCLVGEICG